MPNTQGEPDDSRVLLARTIAGHPLRGLSTALSSALAVLDRLAVLLFRTAVRHTRMHRSHRDEVDLLKSTPAADTRTAIRGRDQPVAMPAR